MTEYIKNIAKKYKFIVEKDNVNSNVDHIIFDDGRQYKFQHPPFMEFHELLFGQEGNYEQNAFIAGLKYIYPENEKSPKIDEKCLDGNFDEALYLWSPLLRGLLLRS